MRKVFLDTNVVIDLLDKRKGFYQSAARIFTLAFRHDLLLYISPLTYATAAYLLRKHPKEELRQLLANLRVLSHVTLVDDQTVDAALAAGFDDFEDALQYCSALNEHVDVLVTRNVKDFSLAKLPVLTPDEFLADRI